MNFKQMQDRVKYTLGLEEIANNDELQLVKAWLNDGVVNVLTRTRPYTRKIVLTPTADTPIHDVGNAILALVDIEYGSHGFLRRYSREDATAMQASGDAGFAYEEPLLWLSPVPGAGVTLNAYGVFRPTAMSGDGDDCAQFTFGALSTEFHEAVIMYGLWKGGEYVQHEGSGQGEKWRMQYEGQDGTEGELARIKRIISKRVTPMAAGRRALTRNLAPLSDSGSYIGAN